MWRSFVRFETGKVAPWMALRNALGTTLPIAAGMAMGHVTSGLIAGSGALNVAFSDGSDPYLRRLRRMSAASLFGALAVVAGSLSGGHPGISLALAGGTAFVAGMLVAVGGAAPDIGNVTLVVLLVYSAQTMTAQQSANAGLLALAGGLFQTGLALVLWPFQRYKPEHRALAALYDGLARAARSDAPATEAPPASAETSEAHSTLDPLAGDHSIDAERCLALLSQAERIRLALMALVRLRARLARHDGTSRETGMLDRCLEVAQGALAAVASSLREAAPGGFRSLDELRTAAETLRQPRHDPHLAGLLRDVRWQLDALAGQLRSALEVAGHATPAGSAEFDRHEGARPWTLRLGGALAALRANVNLKSAAFRHALRLAVCVSAGELLAHAVGWGRSYWLPMTVALVLRPDFATTFTRGVLRLAGTLLGLALATAMFRAASPPAGAEVALIGVFMFLMRAFGPANYGVLAASLTALVVLMFAAAGVAPAPVIAARGLNTLAGGVLALVAYPLWPTWEQTQVPEALARMLDAYRAYFQAVRDAYLAPGQSFAAPLDLSRQAARLARSYAEASVTRLSAEPGVTSERLGALYRILANSHRFIHAVMSLEAGLARSRPVPARGAFRVFANHVDETVYYLAAALRGSPVAAADLPDLREDHYALLQAGDSRVERYQLVNVEADRLTNSLNTLAAELLAFRSV